MIPYDKIKVDVVCINGETTNEKSVTFVEQFVKHVNDFSSQYGSNNSISYTANNVTGNPSNFPDYGDFPQAFVMRTYGQWWNKAPSKLIDYMPQNNNGIVSQDYIDLEYYKEVYPIRISIYETYNPGSVVRIWAQDDNRQWFQLWSGYPQMLPHKPRIFSPHLKLCSFKTKTIRLEFNHDLLDYYTQLDAVLLIGTTDLIVPNNFSHNQSLSTVLQELNKSEQSNDDVYNLTPDYIKMNHDLVIFKKSLSKYCKLCEHKAFNRVPKGELLSKIGHHYHYIPPIEEACNSLQQFLQEEFPKLIRDIQLNSSFATSEQIASIEENRNSISNSGHSTCGSFSALPDETILKVFKNLDLKSLCCLCRVNKHFSNIARDALLYRSLNLKPYWYCIDASALNCLASRCQYLQKLDFSWCGNYNRVKDDDFIKFLSTCGYSLTHLRLNSCQFVNDSVVCEISRTCKNMRELCLRNCMRITNDGFRHLSSLRCLEHLELYRTSIETATLCTILRQNRKMQHLNLAGMHDHLNIDEVAVELGNSCPYLESVDFWKAQTFTPAGLRALTSCTQLREIDFGWCGGMGAPGDSLRLLFSSCKYLEKVFLAALRGLTDRDLEPLLLCSHLRQLDLLGARSLTPDIVHPGLLLCCSNLEMIDLSFCEGISDIRINEWRQLYPHVSIKRNFQTIST